MMESPEIKEQINFTDKNKKSLVTRDTLLDANIEPEKSNDKILATTGDEGGDNGDIEGLSRETSGRPLYSVFTKQQKRLIVFIASLGGFFSPLSASIYFPALNSLATDLNVSVELISLTLTSYMIFQGLAPTFMGDLADMAGRRPTYCLCFTLYIAANIGLALQSSYPALFVLRCLQSTGSSGTIALAYGVVADVALSSERGTYMAFANMGAMVGPAIGPVLGGVLSQYLGWKWIFWFLAIVAVLFFLFMLITYPETARNVVGNGSIQPSLWGMSLLNYLHFRKMERGLGTEERVLSRQRSREARSELTGKRRLRWPNPLGAIHIILEKHSGLILLYNSLLYTAFYTVISSAPIMFHETYGFNDLQIGLAFIPYGVGCAVASFVNGKLQDWNYRRIAKQEGITLDKKRGEDMAHFPIEKARIQVAIPFVLAGQIMTLCYGWAFQYKAPLAIPLLLLFTMGAFVNGGFNVLSTLLVDLHPKTPATATAANNLCRCWLGAAGTAVVIPGIRAMGQGWWFTFVSLLIMVMSPILWIVKKNGLAWREELRQKRERREAPSN